MDDSTARGIVVISVIVSVILVFIAYNNNLENVLDHTNSTLVILILLLLFINVIANIFQIIDFSEGHLLKPHNWQSNYQFVVLRLQIPARNSL